MRASDAPLVYEASDRWIQSALKRSDSLFTPGTAIWSESVVGDLYERLVENPDEGRRNFEDKFRDQLAGAPSATIQLAGELLFVHFLPAVDMTGDHERSLINSVLNWSANPVSVPSDLAAALDEGFSATGVAFRTRRPFQLAFLLEFVRAWKTLDTSGQDRLLADPWAFKEFVFGLPIQGAQTQRSALLHLVHPETFESITSETMKQQVATGFSKYATTESDDVDRQLQEIRMGLTEEYGRQIQFWDDDVKPRWAPAVAPPSDPTAWVFQASPEIYAIDRALAELPSIEWTVRQHRADIHEGDRVYIWRSGPQAGVVAVGRVMSEPSDRPPEERERPSYLRPDRFAETEPRVDVQVDQVLGSPLTRGALSAHPLLRDLTVIRMQGRGTNFRVTEEQDVALRDLLEGAVASESRYFVLQQGTDRTYSWDDEGKTYHFTPNASGAWKRLSQSPNARFVYYRPGRGGGEQARTYFGCGRISEIDEEVRDGERHFLARIADYELFQRPVPSAEFDPRPNVQMSIAEIDRSAFEELLRRGTEAEAVMQPFTLESVKAAASRMGLRIGDSVYANLFAALESGKHVIVTGPPGTGKTTLAQAAAYAAQQGGRCTGYVTTTATADWTTYETIGGLKPDRDEGLSFAEGHFLEAIQRDQWLVIDELNRSNFDRAFGQLFTVLSGQAVELPYERVLGRGRISLVPDGATAPPGTDAITIPSTWRVIATMNVFDKTLLFEMSFALMRRFAFVEVPAPPDEDFEALIEGAAAPNAHAADLAKRFLVMRKFKDLGPAVFMDLARYFRVRSGLDSAQDGQLAFEGFYSYLLPQFEGIDETAGEELFASVRRLVGSAREEHLRDTLNAVLGLELVKTGPAQPDEDDVVAPDEPDIVRPGEQ